MTRNRLGLMLFCSLALAGLTSALAHEPNRPAPPVPVPAPALPGTGFEGRVLYDDEEFAGARIYAYPDFTAILAHQPFAVSAPSDAHGLYSLDLSPGTWFLVAKKLAAGPQDGELQAGDFFSYHGSNPILVKPGVYTHIGFALARKERGVTYESASDTGSGSIQGLVRYQGQPLEGATVFLFLDAGENFRGMVYAASPPTGKSGAFRFDTLPESGYFVIARKRVAGPGTGPLSDGDYFGFFLDNPVTVKAGKAARIELEVMSKVGEIVKTGTAFRDTDTQVRGRITDKEGKVIPGVYAFAYRDKVMAHKRPEFISRAVDEHGNYVLNFSEGGTYYLGARSTYGEGPTMGEWYGRFDVTADHSLVVKTGQRLEDVNIQVEHILP